MCAAPALPSSEPPFSYIPPTPPHPTLHRTVLHHNTEPHKDPRIPLHGIRWPAAAPPGFTEAKHPSRAHTPAWNACMPFHLGSTRCHDAPPSHTPQPVGMKAAAPGVRCPASVDHAGAPQGRDGGRHPPRVRARGSGPRTCCNCTPATSRRPRPGPWPRAAAHHQRLRERRRHVGQSCSLCGATMPIVAPLCGATLCVHLSQLPWCSACGCLPPCIRWQEILMVGE